MGLTDYFKTGNGPSPVRAQAVTAMPSSINVADAVTLRALGVSRKLAMDVPAVAACRNLIAGAVSQMVVSRTRDTEVIEPGYLLEQPDPSSTWSAVLQRTVDDLIFYGRAAWLVIARDGINTGANPGGLPVRARHIPITAIDRRESTVISDYSIVTGYDVQGQRLDPRDIIWFDAGHEGVLTFGARAITQAYDIEQAARRMASVDLPAGVLENNGHELGPDEAADVVAAFQTARETNSVAFLQNVSYRRESLNSHDLQLVEARATSATDIARLFNVPVAMIGASPTGNASALLYSNLSQNTAQFVQQSVGPYLVAIEQALSSDNVTARGQSVRFEVGAFLRTDPESAMNYAAQLVSSGIVTTDEARSFLGIPPTGATLPDITPGRV